MSDTIYLTPLFQWPAGTCGSWPPSPQHKVRFSNQQSVPLGRSQRTVGPGGGVPLSLKAPCLEGGLLQVSTEELGSRDSLDDNLLLGFPLVSPDDVCLPWPHYLPSAHASPLFIPHA